MNVAIDSSNGNVVKHFWPIVSTSFAVKSAMLGNKLGLAVVTCGPHTFIQRVAAKILPSQILMGIWRLIR